MSIGPKDFIYTQTQIRKYVLVLALAWTATVCVSLAFRIVNLRGAAFDLARTQARTAYEKDVVYRRWNALQGRVYVPVSEFTPPNQHLIAARREVRTVDGEELTLVNPAYMTRQIHEIQEDESGIKGHITSLDPIRQENAADDWETSALRSFASGELEISSVEQINGQDYLRFMRPLVVSEDCMLCHAVQGYEVGEVRGGISVSLPMKETYDIMRGEYVKVAGTHVLLGLMGLCVLAVGSRSLIGRVRDHEESELELAAVKSEMVVVSRQTEKAQDKLRQAQATRETMQLVLARAEAAMENVTDAVMISDEQGKVVYVNTSFRSMFRHTVESINEAGMEALFLNPEVLRKVMGSAGLGRRRYIEVEMFGRDHVPFPALFHAEAIADESGSRGVVFSYRDVSAEKRLEEQVHRLDRRDELTQLRDRQSFDESMVKEWGRAARSESPMSLIVMDIDSFGSYNGNYGREAGDNCLKAAASALEGALKRPGDIAARYGEDKFVALLPDTPAEGAAYVAETIRNSISALGIDHDFSVTSECVTVSLGIATVLDARNETPADLTNRAVRAIGQARASGGNCLSSA